MKLVVNEFLSLDGVMQGPGGPGEDPSSGFKSGGWIVPFAAEPGWGEAVSGWFAKADAILLGRSTYDMMYPYWSQVTDPENSVGTALNTLPKLVVSSQGHQPAWNNTTIVGGDPVEQVGRLKERPGGELQLHGSWQLARTLHEAGLIDEYRLLIFPVVVGEGKRLFESGAPPVGFSVVEASIVDTGTVYLELARSDYRRGDLDVVDGKEVLLDA